MQVQARSRYVRVAPDKARQAMAHIRGLGVEEARRMLQFSPKGIAEQILKTLNSAVANAEHNNDLDADDLVVSAAVVDEGPMLKRFRPKSHGRAGAIRKRTSHITITVADDGIDRPAVTAQPESRRRPSLPSRRTRGQQPDAPAPAANAGDQEEK